MLTARKPITVKEAVNQVLKYKKLGHSEYVPIEESDDRYLTEPILADHDVPPFDRSTMDGFALTVADIKKASMESPIELEVIEEIGAGIVANRELKEGQAIRIMTGAQLPVGTAAIVTLESTKQITRENKKYIIITEPLNTGDNITFQGDDTKKGTILVERGRRIDPGVKALLATFGYAKVPVMKKPVVGIFTTGTELLDIHEELLPGKIRNSNSHMIISQIKRLGAEPKNFGILADDFELCFEAMVNALEEVDILITTGGASVGDYDFIPEIFDKLGANVLFNKISMRPGSVTTVAEANGKLLFALAGNPSASFVGFELYVRPWIRTFLGSANPHLQKVQAVLDTDIPGANSFTRFVRGKVSYKNGKLFVSTSGADKSSNVTILANTNALIILPAGNGGYQKGIMIDILLLNEEGSDWPWD